MSAAQDKWNHSTQRQAAHILLHALHVESPDEIDLETIAWKAGKLEIQYGGLKNCDGRNIASTNGGRIRVRDSGSVGRQRFTFAHEIGHFVLHPSPQLAKEDGPAQFSMWHSQSEEVEAMVRGTFAQRARMTCCLVHLAQRRRGAQQCQQAVKRPVFRDEHFCQHFLF